MGEECRDRKKPGIRTVAAFVVKTNENLLLSVTNILEKES